MTATVASFLIALFVKISPYILAQLKPLLKSARSSIWKKAYPKAIEIVERLELSPVPGVDKHRLGVLALEAELIKSGVELDRIARMNLPMIILTAYANSPTVQAALQAEPIKKHED